MARIYLSPVVGNGTAADPQRALIHDLQGVTAVRACIAVQTAPGQGRGAPVLPWSICWVDATDWTSVEAESQVFHLSIDVLDSQLPNPIRNQLRNRGYLTQQEANTLTTIRSAVEMLLHKHYPDADLERAFPGIGR